MMIFHPLRIETLKFETCHLPISEIIQRALQLYVVKLAAIALESRVFLCDFRLDKKNHHH